METAIFYKNIIEMLPDPVFAIDREGKVIVWNNAMESLTNVKREDIVGKSDYAHSMVFYGYKRQTLAELVFQPDKETEKYYYRFQRNEDGSVEGETYSTKMDYYDWGKAVPILGENGEVVAALSISRDITSIKKFEKQQGILLKRFETLFANSPDGIVCLDKNHLIIEVNDSFLSIFGYRREECLGRSPDDLVMPKGQKQAAVNVTNNLFKTGMVDLEDIRYTKNGDPVFVNIRGILMEVNKEIIGGYGIYTDITEKQMYKRQLEESNEELEATNEELEATVEQLMSGEEELRAQYDEIQEYSKKNDELRQKYEFAIEATNSFIWQIDIQKQSVEFSENFLDLVGMDTARKGYIYDVVNTVVHEEDRSIFLNELNKYIKNPKGSVEAQIRILSKEGSIRWYLIRGKGFSLKSKKIDTLYGVLIDITEIKQKEEHIEFLSVHDPLTRLYNRRKLSEILTLEMRNNERGSLILLDLDDFKNVNDVLGHVYGDEVLKKIAQFIRDISPENAMAFRFGGDEFLILLKEGSLRKIRDFAKKLKNTINEKIILNGLENNITATMGIVRYPTDGAHIDVLLTKADIAMYNAKSAGKNKYLFYEKAMEERFKVK